MVVGHNGRLFRLPRRDASPAAEPVHDDDGPVGRPRPARCRQLLLLHVLRLGGRDGVVVEVAHAAVLLEGHVAPGEEADVVVRGGRVGAGQKAANGISYRFSSHCSQPVE